MAERKVERGSVYIREITPHTRESKVFGWPQAIVDGQLYFAAPWEDKDGEHSNRIGRTPVMRGMEHISVVGPVMDLEAAMRKELVFLDGDDGVWIEAMKEYASQEGRQVNG